MPELAVRVLPAIKVGPAELAPKVLLVKMVELVTMVLMPPLLHLTGQAVPQSELMVRTGLIQGLMESRLLKLQSGLQEQPERRSQN